MNKKFIFTIIILILIMTGFYMIPIKIEKEFDGYMYAHNSNFEKATKIKLKGELFRNILQNHKFYGIVEADGITHKVSMTRALEHGTLFRRGHYLDIIIGVNDGGCTRTIGVVMASKDFEMIWVEFYELNEKYNGEFVIYGPAHSRKEAHEINIKFGEE